jgi:hypothetical protein
MTYYGVCQACSEAVKSPQRPAFQVTGFEVPRDQGGTNHVLRRERVPNKVWHERCLPPEKVSGEQGSLL